MPKKILRFGWGQLPGKTEWHYFINSLTLCMEVCKENELVDKPSDGSEPCFQCAFTFNRLQRQAKMARSDNGSN